MKEALEEEVNVLSKDDLKKEILHDYIIACQSREASLLGRKEVLTGKAKFGIFGDGKEIAQIAMAKNFKKGDWRSGYYRDQTFMMAIGELSLEQFFAQLYAHADEQFDPHSGGRQMNAHFATRLLDENGNWKNQTESKNTSADLSPTAAQMPRLLGLAYASKFYRNNSNLSTHNQLFTIQGNEVAFGTIGDASTSEGLFWETINAAGVLQVPMIVSVWDDAYGISVPKKYQTTKESISEVLKGFQRDQKHTGFEIFKAKGWDYAQLCLVYEKAVKIARTEHVPCIIHVEEITQPQGHSTSGSHERYKNEDRLNWEKEHDCIYTMKRWILKNGIATEEELDEIYEQAKQDVKIARKKAWEAYQLPIIEYKNKLTQILSNFSEIDTISLLIESLQKNNELFWADVTMICRKALWNLKHLPEVDLYELIECKKSLDNENFYRFNSFLYNELDNSILSKNSTLPIYGENTKEVDGREILRENFDAVLSKYPEVLIFGEDVGFIGGVNQTVAGLQEKYGKDRVFDTGIREATIIGQAIGLALRGFRPIAEIQYLDYLLYALQIISDDLASLRYRTKNGQKAPVIISTRGHRLEGIWHAGSPMGTILSSFRGLYVCVPRNMTIAAGFYNTLLKGDDPALVIECLNGYRSKEKLPSNPGEYSIPLGVAEVLESGTDVTLVTYGSCIRIAEKAIEELLKHQISVELIDIQTLIPFDTTHIIANSVKKTNKLILLDEDVPGGATAYMLQQILEKQEVFSYLDAPIKTITSKEHRPAYGSDGDYFSKPSAEDIFESVYQMMHEYNPTMYPKINI